MRTSGRAQVFERVRTAFNEYSERYAIEVLEALASTHGVKRVYSEVDLKRAYRGQQVADVAIDYGDAWVIVEVSTIRAERDTINGVDLSGPIQDREKITKKARQISATIDAIRREEARLTGIKRTNRVIFYPVLVLVEGFPSNPLVNSKLREHLAASALLTGGDTAPIEIIDSTELDMIEGISESAGPSLVEILARKWRSNFHADSVRNFLVGDQRYSPQRPRRVKQAFREFLSRVIVTLGGDPSAHSWTAADD
jgi:hypothetical protein